MPENICRYQLPPRHSLFTLTHYTEHMSSNVYDETASVWTPLARNPRLTITIEHINTAKKRLGSTDSFIFPKINCHDMRIMCKMKSTLLCTYGLLIRTCVNPDDFTGNPASSLTRSDGKSVYLTCLYSKYWVASTKNLIRVLCFNFDISSDRYIFITLSWTSGIITYC